MPAQSRVSPHAIFVDVKRATCVNENAPAVVGLAGNEESLNKESYLRLCENTKGRIDEICEQIRFRTDEYRRSLSGESPYEFHLMRWAHAESHSEYRR